MSIGVTSFLFPSILVVASLFFAWFAFVAIRKGAAAAKLSVIEQNKEPLAYWFLTAVYTVLSFLCLVGAVILFGTIFGVMSLRS
jgi:hypothetical protein